MIQSPLIGLFTTKSKKKKKELIRASNTAERFLLLALELFDVFRNGRIYIYNHSISIIVHCQ